VFVIHRSRLPEFAATGALAELTADDYAKAGIDVGDFTDRAVSAVTYKGKHYGMPLDFHAYLWHVNMGLMKQAGLVTARRNGRSILYAADYDAMNRLLAYLTENCCAGDPAACGLPECDPLAALPHGKGNRKDEAPAPARRRQRPH
jgi:maltose-binding protein MalE